MTQWYGAVLGALAAIGLLMVARQLRRRLRRRSRRRVRRPEPLLRTQRNGRVRFHLEDLRRSAAPAAHRRPGPDLEHTIPDLEMTIPDLLGHGLPRQRPNHPGD